MEKVNLTYIGRLGWFIVVMASAVGLVGLWVTTLAWIVT